MQSEERVAGIGEEKEKKSAKVLVIGFYYLPVRRSDKKQFVFKIVSMKHASRFPTESL